MELNKIELTKETIELAYQNFKNRLPIFSKIYDYYCGNTDALKNYVSTDRSNLKVSCNYIKKFIKEEVSYSVGNDITYASKTGNSKELEVIDSILENFKEDHDVTLAKWLLTFGVAYEIYFINSFGDFNSKVVMPNAGYAIQKEGETIAFLHQFIDPVDNEIYVDLYTSSEIRHLNKDLEPIRDSTPHYFGEVPVGVCRISEEEYLDTIYNDLKGLQDSLETNLSDVTNEISDFRNAYLLITGVTIDEEVLKECKKRGCFENPSADGKIEWLIKNINDSFIQNTINTIRNEMYQLVSHINNNEGMSSNNSGVALRARIMNMEARCKTNQRALTECLKTRIRIMFIYASITGKGNFNWKDIKYKFTPSIPQDDVQVANIIRGLDGIISKETALAQLSFIENPLQEIEKLKAEEEEAKEIYDNNFVFGTPGKKTTAPVVEE